MGKSKNFSVAKPAPTQPKRRRAAKSVASRATAPRKGAVQASAEFSGFGVNAKVKWGTQSVTGLGAVTPPRPSFSISSLSGARDGVVVRGMDVFVGGSLTGSAYSEGTIVSSTYVHPRSIASSRLGDVAGLYTRYRFRRMNLYWIPGNSITASAAQGEIMYSFERDPTQREAVGSIVNFSDFYAREGSVVGNEYAPIKASFIPDGPGWYYVDEANDPDVRLTYQAVAYMVAGANLSSQALGKTYVEYEVEFVEPRTEHEAVGEVYYGSYSTYPYTSYNTANWLTPSGGNSYKQSRHPYLNIRAVNNDGVYLDVKAGWSGVFQIILSRVTSGTITVPSGGWIGFSASTLSGSAVVTSNVTGLLTPNGTPNQLITSSTTQNSSVSLFSVFQTGTPTDSVVSLTQTGSGSCAFSSVFWGILQIYAFPLPKTYQPMMTAGGLVRQKVEMYNPVSVVADVQSPDDDVRSIYSDEEPRTLRFTARSRARDLRVSTA